MRKYRIIGLTGPTGSGKSIAADIFRQLGFSVVNADALSRKSLRKGSVTLRILQAIFGNDIADSSGEPNRQLIAQRAFSSKENTKILNAVTHSQIYMLAMAEFKALTDSGAENIVFDAPTLLDGNGQFVCDYVVTVLADRNERLQRIIQRDGISRRQANERLEAQHSDEFYISASDFVIYNNSDFTELKNQIESFLGGIDFAE